MSMNHEKSSRGNRNRKKSKSPKSKSPKSKSPKSKSPKLHEDELVKKLMKAFSTVCKSKSPKLHEDELLKNLMEAFSTVWFDGGYGLVSRFENTRSSGKKHAASSSGSSKPKDIGSSSSGKKHAASSSGSSKLHSFGFPLLAKDYSSRGAKDYSSRGKSSAVKFEDAGSVLESKRHFTDDSEDLRRSYSEVLAAPPTPASVSAQSVSRSLFNTPGKPDPLKILVEKYRDKCVQDVKPFAHAKGRSQTPSESQMIFAKNNAETSNTITLDLHGQQAKPALERIKDCLSVSAYLAIRRVVAITGRGKHSKGRPVLRDVINTVLEREGILCKRESKNDGALSIYPDGRTDYSSLDIDSY